MSEIKITKITGPTQPRSKKTQTQPRCVRMMLPITITCKTCRRNMYEGTKFSTHKQNVSALVFRYYFSCPCCKAEISIKANQQNAELIVESGAFQPLPGQAEVQQGAES